MKANQLASRLQVKAASNRRSKMMDEVRRDSERDDDDDKPRPADKMVLRLVKEARAQIGDAIDSMGYGGNMEFDDALGELVSPTEDLLVACLLMDIRASKQGDFTIEQLKKEMQKMANSAFKRAKVLAAKDPK